MPASIRGAALVIVLSILVLMAGVVMAFFSQSMLQRQIANSSASQTSVELFAHGALNTIVGDLRQEIIAGSVASSTDNLTIYTPLASANAAPALAGATGTGGTENLIKRSAFNIPFYTNGLARAAQISSTGTSRNGRSISLARWNKPLLLTKATQTSDTDLTPVSAFSAPDWVLVDGGGANPTSWNRNMIWTGSTANTHVVMGRYAYTIYNEGCLLDANVAGYPAAGATTGTIYGNKNSVAFADLTQLGFTQTEVNALVGWRNNASLKVSGTSPNYTLDTSANGQAAYASLVASNSNGFLTISSTATNTAAYGASDRMFIGRQNLINFFLNSVAQSTTERADIQNALLYLGTFSRQIAAPSFSPGSSRNKTLTGQGYRGGTTDPGDQDDLFNPSLVNTRVSTSFTRDSDGTKATLGEPLLKHRFPLSRLALVTHSATADTTSSIYKYFGLTRSSSTSPWIYNHGDAAHILKLSEVALAGREPDFFELLQAAILVGSLGKASGNTLQNIGTYDADNYLQILQIGANIIDQYDEDSYPTLISFNPPTSTTLTSKPWIVKGVEDLPYLTSIYEVPYRLLTNNGSDVRPYAGIWFVPEIWRIHSLSVAATAGPTQFRVVAAGSVHSHFYGNSGAVDSAITTFPDPDTNAASGIEFSSSAGTFSSPTVLSPSVGATASGSNNVDSTLSKTPFVGICAGYAYALESDLNSSNAKAKHYTWAYAQPDSEITFRLQYLDGSTWITYDEMRSITGAMAGSARTTDFGTYSLNLYRGRIDPRTDRFGSYGVWDKPNYKTNETLRPDTSRGYVMLIGAQKPSDGWTHSGPIQSGGYTGYSYNAYFGWLTQNTSSAETRYTDPDGVLRRASGAYADGLSSGGNYPGYPLATGNSASRPIMLNRAFRSVADIGYASRGIPWKELDFFTAESADAALLDVFCLQEDSRDPALLAGRVDLNGRQWPVYKAILLGALKSELDSSATMGDTDAEVIAKALVARVAATSKGPLLNRSELVTKFSDDIEYSSSLDACIKPRREAAIRALAETGETRTWNLLIDVVAQSGRYPLTASSLSDFIVEGERRYWLHLAIDRYTGKVTDQYLEPVYE